MLPIYHKNITPQSGGVSAVVFAHLYIGLPVQIANYTMRRFLCRRSTAQATLPIGAYVNDLYAVDKTLIAMIHKTEMEILRVTKLGSSKHTARRRILLKRHKASIEERRDMILARILQLENLHINNLQIDALRGVTKAFQGSKYTIGDVDSLLDKLEDFKDDFEAINDRLSEDMAFQGIEVDDAELMAELEQLEHSDTRTVQNILTTVPSPPPAAKQVDIERPKEDTDTENETAERLLPVLS